MSTTTNGSALAGAQIREGGACRVVARQVGRVQQPARVGAAVLEAAVVDVEGVELVPGARVAEAAVDRVLLCLAELAAAGREQRGSEAVRVVVAGMAVVEESGAAEVAPGDFEGRSVGIPIRTDAGVREAGGQGRWLGQPLASAPRSTLSPV